MRTDSTPKSPAKFVYWLRHRQCWRICVERNKRIVFSKYTRDINEAIAESARLVAIYCNTKPEKSPGKPTVHSDIPWRKRPENRERRLAARQRMIEKRRAWYREFMDGRTCEDCGKGKEDGIVLQWHHRDPSAKTMEVARMVANHNPDKMMAEIAKCTLLCKDCHWKYHRTRH